ncbi:MULTISPECIES: glycosyltransferase [Metallosphaera]|uniref:Glycosyl transferase, group 1 n=3 Tax=Metallosphaera TaxID=41980 RepID=A4YGB2_METS5|nr:MULTISPECIES: glycosyltransferase [Metallosphaera]ABP95464.1 glycosyl transferase, group 1 [Metallosphaera sedula DSM 5348]AIM27449.1 glycosyl transferase, group 1 [Metallosphaera sedula]AKV74323.1 glycosyl transferase [Metallosphaera sedula]AKV76562.1 glycosyl transferase [Metallosphaera sedula]AKV78814.1 glycosyl transferase [Metallosphaera sedula]
MRVLAVVDFGLVEHSGGYKRNLEIMRRLPSYLEVDIVPSLRNVRLALSGHRDELISLLKDLKATVSLDALRDANSLEEFLKLLRPGKYDLALVYSNSGENVELASTLTNSPVGVQLQLEPFYRDLSTLFRIKFRGSTGRALTRFQRAVQESKEEERTWLSLIRAGKLNFAISVSRIPLTYSGLDQMIPYDVTTPGNAIDPEVSKVRREKEDYAVYFTRLIPEKGLFDVPLIWKRVNEHRDMRLYVMGQFLSEDDREEFTRLVRRLNVNVEYLGFRSGEDLYKVVAGAQFTLYPSHYDSFSLVVLESLALNTSVIAYDTPAIREIYRGVKGVHTVEEDNLSGMASLCLKQERSEVNVPEMYSSWDKVALAELASINRMARTFSINGIF